MLVLVRKIGQQIVLPGCGVTIDVLDLGKTRVRLGIAAPADIPVHRGEVWDRILRRGENQPGRNAELTNKPTLLADEPANLNAAGIVPTWIL